MLFAGHGAVAIRLTDGEGKSGARRGERLEAQILQQPGAARVPGIGDDENARLFMECRECNSLVLLRDHGVLSQKSLSCSPGMGRRRNKSVVSCNRSRLKPSLLAAISK